MTAPADWSMERLRGDDGAGPLVIERLGGDNGGDLLDAETTPENFYGVLLGRAPEVVLFVDAADLGAPPGTCALAPVEDLAARAESTHAPSLRLLGRLLAPRRIECWLLGIQPASTAPGGPVHPVVAAAIDRAAAAIAALLPRTVPHAPPDEASHEVIHD